MGGSEEWESMFIKVGDHHREYRRAVRTNDQMMLKSNHGRRLQHVLSRQTL
jgi:hypothetical protein